MSNEVWVTWEDGEALHDTVELEEHARINHLKKAFVKQQNLHGIPPAKIKVREPGKSEILDVEDELKKYFVGTKRETAGPGQSKTTALVLTLPSSSNITGAIPTESDRIDPVDIKTLAEFAREAMESKTEKKDMSKASTKFAQGLLSAMSITVTNDTPNKETTGVPEPKPYSWKVQSVDGDIINLGEHQGTPGARKWFRDNFLSGGLESEGYTCKVATGVSLPNLKAGGKSASGRADMVIGKEADIDLADNLYEQAEGLIELKTDEYPIKVGQILLEITAFSEISRFGRAVVLLSSDCNQKWGLVWFRDYNTICRRKYLSARKCWADFQALVKNAENRRMELPPKKRLASVLEDEDDEQDVSGFDLENDSKQKAIDTEAALHQMANYLEDIYGERPVVPEWARAERTCPSYYT